MPYARPLLLAVLALCAQRAFAAPAPAAPMRPPANCGLAAPPPDAGVDRHMGALLRIYPRNPDIGPDYDGCQTLWLQDADGWAPITVVHYERGHVVRVESPAADHDPVEQCLVKDGAVVRGDPGLCAQLDDMRFESMPAGCSGAADGADAPQCARR